MDKKIPTLEPSPKPNPVLWALGGFLLGAVVVYSIFEVRFQRRGTEVWVLKEPAQANGVVIPAGTKFVHSYTFSEGFYQVALHLNIEASDRNRFSIKHDSVTDNQFPYWLKFNPDPPKTK
jgi:hypothetical protein